MDDVALSVSISHVWSSVREIRGRIGLLLAKHPLELRLAAMMAGGELLENAVKYGEAVARAPQISFDLTLVGHVMQIGTVNGSRDAERMSRLNTIIRRIAAAKDKNALYLGVIEEMVRNFDPRLQGGLGLYRIAAEGKFAISCECRDEVVRMFARRGLDE